MRTMNNQEPKQEDISINITRHYRPDLEFSIVSMGGLFEILQLYVEVEKMYYCVSGPTMIEAMFFRTKYSIILVPTIKIYPLLLPTINSGDTWVLKEKDVDLFGISFKWPSLMAADVVIKAKVYDHMHQITKTISTNVIRLQRNGEYIADKNSKRFSLFAEHIPDKADFVPEDNPIPLTPYLYKLATIDDFIAKVNVQEAKQLNEAAYQEIAKIFKTDMSGLGKLLSNDKPQGNPMFGATIHPSLAQQLIKVAKVLHSYLYPPSIPTKIPAITEVVMGNKYSFNNITGSIITVDSMLEQVTQNIKSASNVDEVDKEQLSNLIEQLKLELQKVPQTEKEKAEAVADSAKTITEASIKNPPNKETIKISAEGLRKAAENIGNVAPTVLTIASSIVKTVFHLVGIPLP